MNIRNGALELDIDNDLYTRSLPLVHVLVEQNFASRLGAKDASLWGESAAEEATNRLGWVDALDRAESLVLETNEIRDRLYAQGLNHTILCGMGGSSLGPEMLARWGQGSLTVLDSTYPDSVTDALMKLEHSAIIVSSKSGSTVETRSQLALIEERLREAGLAASERIIVITDPDSELERYAQAKEYTVVRGDASVGGRFSLFTAFGIVPAMLSGVHVDRLLESAAMFAGDIFTDAEDNVALCLAAAIVAQGFAMPLEDSYSEFGLGDWIEQLVAESTGKSGRGILPVLKGVHNGESASIRIRGELGAELVAWMVATAAMGVLLGVNPFDQPDVESAKRAARSLLHVKGISLESSERTYLSAAEAVSSLRGEMASSAYIALQIFGDSRTNKQSAQLLREQISVLSGLPVTVGWGPRFLHSTGQLHKGGPKDGLFLQMTPPPSGDIDIPGQAYSFGALISAQANGDAQVLEVSGQRVICTHASPEELSRELSTEA